MYEITKLMYKAMKKLNDKNWDQSYFDIPNTINRIDKNNNNVRYDLYTSIDVETEQITIQYLGNDGTFLDLKKTLKEIKKTNTIKK